MLRNVIERRKRKLREEEREEKGSKLPSCPCLTHQNVLYPSTKAEEGKKKKTLRKKKRKKKKKRPKASTLSIR